MSNKIGQYIHYNYDNYLDWGLRRKEWVAGETKKSSVSPMSIIRAHHNGINNYLNTISSKYSKAQIRELEQKLNFFYAWGSPNASVADQDARKTIEDIIKQIWGQKFIIDFDSLNVRTGNGFEDVVKELEEHASYSLSQLTKIGSNRSEKANFVTIDKRVEELKKLRNTLVDHAKSGENFEKFIDSVNKIVEKWEPLKNNKKNRRLSLREKGGLVSSINQLILDLKLNSSSFKGELAEFVLYCAQLAATGKLRSSAGEIYQMFIDDKNSRKSAKGIATNFIDARIIQNMTPIKGSTRHKLYANKGLFTTMVTEDKVDLVIDLDKIHAPISIKNYDLSKHATLSLLNGRSLLGLVQEYPHFVNHFLNIVPERVGNDEAEGSRPNEALVKKAKEAMKLTILLKALVGGVYGIGRSGEVGKSASADFFVVNDSSAQNPKFRVFQMGTIVNNVKKDINNLLVTGDYDTYTFKNQWTGDEKLSGVSANKRIANLLMQMHQIGLAVSINKAVLNLKN